jgi:hypothetical protein
MSTPDEIASALTDEKLRVQWDPSIKSITKNNEEENSVKI